MKDHYEVLIVGGGTAGLTAASQLALAEDPPDMGLIEPSEEHYYQPLWTLVGGGVFPREESMRREADFIPEGVDWIRDRVASFNPDANQVQTEGGRTITYDWLVVTMGIQVDWDAIPGLAESVGKPGTGVVSNYSYDTCEATWEAIRSFKGGAFFFTEPVTGVKCGGAPQKIMYLAEDHARRSGIREKCRFVFCNAKGTLFSSPHYQTTLEKIIEDRGMELRLKTNLVELRPDAHEAVFRHTETEEETVERYDFIHVTPPMSAPAPLKRSPLGNEGGWVEVDQHTTRHVRFPNVFSCGDCSSLPTSKTGAAIRKQAPTLVKNLLAARAGREPAESYDGYTSCPLVTGYGRLVLAEFDYSKGPTESFPFDQNKERYSMYALKAYGLPRMYWHGMLKGRM